MKKFFSMMMIAVAAFGFAACETTGEDDSQGGGQGGGNKGGKLATPELSETHTETSITITWGAIENAETYIVNLSGKTNTTEECSYTFENLNAGKYTIRVGAKADGYEDSDLAKIEVTLTGATEVDWFTQTFTLPEEEDPDKNIYRCNTADFSWKGTGVTDLVFGIWTTEALEGATNSDIIANLTAPEGLSDILKEVNSEEGCVRSFSGNLSGDTSYTLCVQVTNENGVKFLAKNELTTEAANTSEAAKAWIGTWEVSSHKIYSIDNKGVGVTSDQEDKFDVTITASANHPDEVYVYNYTVLGPNAWPAIGQVYDNQLYLINGIALDYNQENAFYYYWLGWYDFGTGEVQPSIDELPFAIVEMAEDATAATYYNTFTLYDSNQNPVSVTCHAADIFGVSEQGNIFFLGIEDFPAVYRTGQMEWVRKEATVSAKSLSFQEPTFSALQSNVAVK